MVGWWPTPSSGPAQHAFSAAAGTAEQQGDASSAVGAVAQQGSSAGAMLVSDPGSHEAARLAHPSTPSPLHAPGATPPLPVSPDGQGLPPIALEATGSRRVARRNPPASPALPVTGPGPLRVLPRGGAERINGPGHLRIRRTARPRPTIAPPLRAPPRPRRLPPPQSGPRPPRHLPRPLRGRARRPPPTAPRRGGVRRAPPLRRPHARLRSPPMPRLPGRPPRPLLL